MVWTCGKNGRRKIGKESVRGVISRERSRKCWLDGVLVRKALDIQEARDCVQDRNEWRSICHGGRCAAGEPPE